MTYTVKVYLDNGVIFYYHVSSDKSAREHAAAIIKGGYVHNDGKGEFEHYPSHRITKVKVTGGIIPTNYPDEIEGT